MSKPLSSLSSDMKRLSVSIDEVVSDVMKDVAVESTIGVAEGNPVDTGLSSGNWQVSSGTPTPRTSGGILHPLRIGEVGLSSFGAPSSVARARQDLGGKKNKVRKVFLMNTISYVRDLNFGRAAGFIQRGVQKGAHMALNKKRKI